MNKSTKMSETRAHLLRLLDEAFNGKAWHGPHLRGSLRLVTPEQAVWRPKTGRHNIAEIALHCAYWKYAVKRRILGAKKGSFPLKGSNWFATPAKLSATQWREYVILLDQVHVELREAISESPWSRLADGPGGGGPKPADHVHGVAMHDVYHTGQIYTLKSLYKQATGK